MKDAFGHPQTMVVLGGTSDIAAAVVDELARQRLHTLVLAGRDQAGLQGAAERARQAGVTTVATVLFDATDVPGAARTVEECFGAAGQSVDVVLVAVGTLGDQERDELDPARAAAVLTVDTVWPSAALVAVATRLREQGYGRAVVLSSVAGVRVRRSNFVYGAAKAGLDAFALGLGESLRGTGASLQVVRPGFVATKMTAGRPPAPFATTPHAVAQAIAQGLGTTAPVLWVPGLLRSAFAVLRLLPVALWRRLPG